MKTIEFGKENEQVIILLHGGGLSWWHYKEVAHLLKKDYHVILPILDGHSQSDRDFTTIENNALEIIEFIDKNFQGSIYLLGGCSLGGQIVLEILSKRKEICKHAIIESALIIPMKFTHACVKPMMELSFPLIKEKWFAKLQFKSLKIKQDLFEEYYEDTCAITKENMISFLKANTSYQIKESIKDTNASVSIYVGEKESLKMIHSAKQIHQCIPNSTLTIIKKMAHGEFSINHAFDYIKNIK